MRLFARQINGLSKAIKLRVITKSNFLSCRLMILIQWKIIFSTSAKIGLSCDIKSLFRWKSVDKKLQIFTFIFHPVVLHFFDFFIIILLHSAISFDHKKKIIKFSSLLINLWSIKKKSLHNKKLDFSTLSRAGHWTYITQVGLFLSASLFLSKGLFYQMRSL